VMKCLEKDRARRYDTANALASDIQRHLNSEPVVARPPSRLYEFQKTVRRHKLGFAAAGVVVCALVLGFGISTWSLAKERQARLRADTEAAKSQQIARFLEDMLRGIDPALAQGRDTAWLREVLNYTATRAARDLTNQPLVEAHLVTIIGSVYARLGELGKAEEMARHGLDLRRKYLGDENAEVASSILDVAYVLGRQGRLTEAETTAREAVAVGTKALGRKDLFVANALGLLGLVLQDEHKLPEAERMYRESLDIRRELLGKDDYSVAIALNSLSGVLTFEGKLAEAETASLEALTITRRASGSDTLGLSQVIYNRGNVFYERGKLAEAEKCFREALSLRRKSLGGNHHDTGVALSALANTLRHEQKYSEAEPLFRECLTLRERIAPKAWYTAYTRVMLGSTLAGEKKFEEAEPLLLSGYEGIKERDTGIRERRKVFTDALENLVQLYTATSRPGPAAEWQEKLDALR